MCLHDLKRRQRRVVESQEKPLSGYDDQSCSQIFTEQEFANKAQWVNPRHFRISDHVYCG